MITVQDLHDLGYSVAKGTSFRPDKNSRYTGAVVMAKELDDGKVESYLCLYTLVEGSFVYAPPEKLTNTFIDRIKEGFKGSEVMTYKGLFMGGIK